MAVAKNCRATELEEAIGDTVNIQVNVASGGMAVIGSDNVIKADNIDIVQHIGRQQKSENTVSGEFNSIQRRKCCCPPPSTKHCCSMLERQEILTDFFSNLISN